MKGIVMQTDSQTSGQSGSSPSERVILAGRTYPVRAEIKAMGGRWDPARKHWTVPAERAAEAAALVEAAASAARSKEETIECHECGGRYTYSEVRRHGGCWWSSYCGCD